MKYQVSADINSIHTKITLPASKSISNRVMIINALNYSPYPVKNLSDCDDTNVMAKVLMSGTNKFNIGHAGTAMRFLTAYLSKIVGQWEITGSARMKQRPIGILVDALEKLGAKIEYIENEGFPPLRIWGSHLKGGLIELDGSISSQYITALLLIAPTLENGLTLRLQNKITSASYIKLTLELMKKFGAHYQWHGNEITIPEQEYSQLDFTVEPDWSGASYWYQLAAIADNAELTLKNLELPSLQGDAAIAGWFRDFGIETSVVGGGVKLLKTGGQTPAFLKLDFIENPDIAQTMAVLCVAKNTPFHFTGLETLKIKETDRIQALITELRKFGACLTEPACGELAWDGETNKCEIKEKPVVETYNDHRMALAFAPLALAGYRFSINNPGVVSKSYPGYWDDLQKAGLRVLKC